jgi:hypothetical protein
VGKFPVHVKFVRTPNDCHRAGNLNASDGISLIDFAEVFRIANEVQKALETFLSKTGHFSRDVFEIGGKTTTLLHQIGVVFVHSLKETANHIANHQRIRWGSLSFSLEKEKDGQ